MIYQRRRDEIRVLMKVEELRAAVRTLEALLVGGHEVAQVTVRSLTPALTIMRDDSDTPHEEMARGWTT